MAIACVSSVIGVAIAIELTGGLPSQLGHLYYLPVTLGALLLPRRLALAIALLAAFAVSPAIDLAVHRPLGRDVYYPDGSPLNFASNGWIVRPLAFLAIGFITSTLISERVQRLSAEATARMLATRLSEEANARLQTETLSEHRGQELTTLHDIDTMILKGADEEAALREIARLVAGVMHSQHAAIVMPDREQAEKLTIFRGGGDATGPPAHADLTFSEGVCGWALRRGSVATCSDVFEDPRYEGMHDLLRRAGYVSAAPIRFDGETIAALFVGFAEGRDFTPHDIATVQRIADRTAIAVAIARQRDSLQGLVHDTAIALSDAIESRDPYTGDHCSRLVRYAALTGAQLGLTRKQLEVLRLGAALHDVGKIVVPDEILKKPDKLTPDEYAVIKQHCYFGGQICKRVSFLRAVYPIVYHHHERYDGKGYPDAIKGDRIPLGARIVAAVDAYDAMTSDRPYRNAMPEEEALAILRDGSGTQWDPLVVDALLKVLAVPVAGANAVAVGRVRIATDG